MTQHSPLNPPLPNDSESLSWETLYGASQGLAISNAIQKAGRPILIITENNLSAARLEKELIFFQQDCEILQFPDWETLPYDRFSPHQDIISERLIALYKIQNMHKGALITSISNLMHRLAPLDYLAGHTFLLKEKDILVIDESRLRLEKSGYTCVNQVREHGEFAVRGSIIDIYPMGSTTPFRIDLLGNEIDSIRTFSPETQRTLEKVSEIHMLPAKEFPLDENSIEFFRSEWRKSFSGNPLNSTVYQDVSEGICPPGIEYYLPLFFERTSTLFDYCPKNTLIITVHDIEKHAHEFWNEIETRYEQYRHDTQHPLLTPAKVFLTTDEITQHIEKYARVSIDGNHDAEVKFATVPLPSLNIDHKSTQPLAAFKQFISEYEGRILIAAETTGRREVLLSLLQRIEFHPTFFATWAEFLKSDQRYGMTIASLEEGFNLLEPKIALIAESQLFGKRVMQSRRRKTTFQEAEDVVKNLTEMQIGDPIVHLDHGVGRYLGLQTLTIADFPAEFVAIEYEGHDKLYVPVASLHLISRYSGSDKEHAPLHKLGSGHWDKAKKKTAEKVKDVAAELLEIYAKRLANKGFAHTLDQNQFETFVANFPFEETADQLRAIEDVSKDMQQEKPMDRLVCGDVGFGKTEVAMRAAFIAIQNNKQVAVLVPTTLLAQQHFQTFQDRFSDWPVRIEVLSRFKTAKEQKEIVEKISEGKIDVVIGTHKLLQGQIQFKSLGLLIIDEEHRFGVQQKEKLKAFRTSVDILALTATPIPRTLNMAFAGIRDLSIIATPPARRLSIKTFVQENQDIVIKEAVLREILRGGQVYFLHNEVTSIERFANDLQKLIPEARIGIAHGQMRERKLEEVMSDFYHRRFNVLVCTTIIESGIDVPSANTIIMHRADKLGLAQLHQLRGRVGRSHHQAYAYLLIPPQKLISKDALKRLDAIAAYEDLGIGFTLATHDLEIRGAGELLGEEQSGNMHEVGFTLYMDLLSRAVDSLKSGKMIESPSETHTEINLQLPALIPEHYLGDVQLRLQFYKRIAETKTERDLDEIQIEMIDRFGLTPPALKNLFAIALLRQKAERLGIKKIEANAKGSKLEFIEKPHVDPLKIIHLIQKDPSHFKLEGPSTIKFLLEPHEVPQRIAIINGVLDKLVG